MNTRTACLKALIWAVVVLMAAPLVFAQDNKTTFSRAQLDQMLAPVALYPDSLLAQVLIAATYPDQVAEAALWVKDHPDLKGEALNSELDKMNWDLSVKALAPFPQVLSMMTEHMDWTTQLGEAFLGQQKEVMSEIQEMRHKAYAAGNLKSTEQQRVAVRGDAIEIEPAQPDIVYEPYYDPTVIYGSWWWPDYPPFAWYPFGSPFITVGLFGFGWGIGVGPAWGWGWGSWNWGGGDVFINVNRTVNINDPHSGLTRNNLRTANLTRVAGTGVRDPVRTAAARAGGRTVSGRGTAAGFGTAGRAGAFSRQGAAGRTATGNVSRPSAATVTNELRHGGAASRTGNVARGGGRTRTSNVARGTAGGSRRTGNISRGAGLGRERDIGGPRRSSSVARGGASHFSSPHYAAPHMGGFGGGHFAGGGARFGGGGAHFGGGGHAGGGGHVGGGGHAGGGGRHR